MQTLRYSGVVCEDTNNGKKSISRGHMFNNGNKRTSVDFFLEFARQNGIKINLSTNELLDISTKVATGEIDDVTEIAKYLTK
jgi:death-on-curing protein